MWLGFTQLQLWDRWDVGNRLDAEEWRSNGVGSGMSVDVRNQLDARKRKGRRSVGLGMCRLDARESECSGVHHWDVSWLRMEPEGLGVALGARGWFWWLGMGTSVNPLRRPIRYIYFYRCIHLIGLRVLGIPNPWCMLGFRQHIHGVSPVLPN